jgi:hypothetical protein
MKTDVRGSRDKKRDRRGGRTKDLFEIEKAGYQWALRCLDCYLTKEDLQFFATEYKPFYESMKEMQEGMGSVVDFDPYSQHKDCRILFSIAFSLHGARMLTPPEFPAGRVPDLRFAAFERGVIKSLRNLYKLEKDGKLHVE